MLAMRYLFLHGTSIFASPGAGELRSARVQVLVKPVEQPGGGHARHRQVISACSSSRRASSRSAAIVLASTSFGTDHLRVVRCQMPPVAGQALSPQIAVEIGSAGVHGPVQRDRTRGRAVGDGVDQLPILAEG
jgi:hypothetical protein